MDKRRLARYHRLNVMNMKKHKVLPVIENKFVIISPIYNTEPYIRKCMMSAITQTYRNFEYIVIDDCCTDGSSEIIREIQAEYPFVKVHRNEIRTESPIGNFKLAVDIFKGDKEDILVTLDGDDWLYDDNVLEHLNRVYQNPNVWMTYGQYVSASGKFHGMSSQLTDTKNYRRTGGWVTSHLRTIKRKLFANIKDEDLRDSDGNYYIWYPDAAYMYPAVEMAGITHSRFIDKVLYVYNDLNPLCTAEDWKDAKKMKHKHEVIREIRRKPIYPELHIL